MSVVGALRVIGICCVLFSACGRQKPPPPAAMREISTRARAPVDAPDEVIKERRIRRLDELFRILRAKRELWKQLNLGRPFPGVVLLRFDQREIAAVVKSVFQTAAFAGYPNASFVVRKIGATGEARLNVDGRPAVQPGASEQSGDRILHLDLIGPDRCQLVWKQRTQVTNVIDVATGVSDPGVAGNQAIRFPKLSALAESEWRVHGAHRDVSDRKFDLAVVHVGNEIEHKHIVAAIDALSTPQRPFSFNGNVEQVSAFEVGLAMN